ncbi:MAG: hypothetical protein IT469_01795 [Pseudomonadales bacterium]|nr:hypothetical protein [Pseudomonadales bacterium]
MQTIKLITAQRDHVARLKCHPFITPPEVILWGGRAFRRQAAPFETDRVPEYTELFVYVVPPTAEVDRQGYVAP